MKINSKTNLDDQSSTDKILNAILIATPIGLGLFQNGKFIWSNEALKEILGVNNLNNRTEIEKIKIRTSVSKRLVKILQLIEEIDFGEIVMQIQKFDGTITECLMFTCSVDINNPAKGQIIALTDISEQKRIEEEFKKSQEQLNQLALHIENIREEEKKRISFEIHDELGYALTALKLDLAWLRNKMDSSAEASLQRINSMTELIDSTIKKIRTICTELRPSILDHFGLAAAIEWQIKEFQKRTGIKCNLIIDDCNAVLQEKYSVMIFRILQEALTNVARHSLASQLNVTYTIKNNDLELIIADNGVGIKTDDIYSSETFGLLSMRVRANSIGGNFEIKSGKNIGTTINLKVHIPSKEIHYD